MSTHHDEEWGIVSLGDDVPTTEQSFNSENPHDHSHSEDSHGHSHSEKSHGHSHSHSSKHSSHSHSHGDKKGKGYSHSHGDKKGKGHAHSHGDKKGKGHGHSHGGSPCSGHAHGDELDIPTSSSSSSSFGWIRSAARSTLLSISYALSSLRGFLRAVSRDEDNRPLLVFVALRWCWLLLLLLFSNYVQSLALTAFSYQAFMDCLQLGVRLVAVHFKSQPPSDAWTYGASRVDVLLRFSCGLYGLFFATFISFEALEHLTEEPHHPSSFTAVFVVVFNGLLLNLLSIIFIRKHVLGGRAEHRQQLSAFVQRNSHALLMENAPCLVLLLGAWFAELGIARHDSIAALLIAAIAFSVSLPICTEMGRIILLASPAQIKDVLYKTLKEASHVDGVLETCDEHFWANSPGEFVGTLTLRVNHSADENLVLERVTQMFSHIVSHLTIQVEKG